MRRSVSGSCASYRPDQAAHWDLEYLRNQGVSPRVVFVCARGGFSLVVGVRRATHIFVVMNIILLSRSRMFWTLFWRCSFYFERCARRTIRLANAAAPSSCRPRRFARRWAARDANARGAT